MKASAWLFGALLLVVAPPAGAQPQLEDGAPALATQRYLNGRELYLAGEFDAAAAEFEIALELFPESAKLAYNLARCQERRAKYAEAADLYDRYLKFSPDATDRAEVLALIKALRRRAGGGEPTAAAAEPAPSGEPATRPADTGVASSEVPRARSDEPGISVLVMTAMIANLDNDKLKLKFQGNTTSSDGDDEDLESVLAAMGSYDVAIGGDRFRVGGRAGYLQAALEANDDLKLRTVDLGAYARYLVPAGRGTFFVAAGLGGTWAKFEGDASIPLETGQSVAIEIEADGFGWHAMGGVGAQFPLGQVHLQAGVYYLAQFLPELTGEISGSQLTAKIDTTYEDNRTGFVLIGAGLMF